VVLGAQSQLPERPGFVVGVLAAVLMSSVAKHIACLEEKIVEKGGPPDLSKALEVRTTILFRMWEA